jgi:uncharacterized protein
MFHPFRYSWVFVNNPRRPFRLNVGFIVNQPVGYSHQFDFNLPKIQISDDLDLHHFTGSATIDRTPQGLFVRAEFKARLNQECVRCLSSFTQNIQWTMSELYAFNQKLITDAGLILPEDTHIDIQPLIREYAMLEIPINPICKPDCKGLCSVCGEDLNARDCGHQSRSEESPFSVLKELLE